MDTRMCSVCGISAPKFCSKCKCVRYCSREHQLFDWNQGNHKSTCGGIIKNSQFNTNNQAHGPSLLFPNFEIVSEQEPNQLVSKPEQESELIKKAIEMMGVDAVNVEEEDDEEEDDPNDTLEQAAKEAMIEDELKAEDSSVDVDKAFLKFQKRLLREPQQILR